MPYRKIEGSDDVQYVCDWCGKTVDWNGDSLPPEWRAIDYDTNKYTEEIEDAVVCSVECEVRLAEKFAAGGLR